MEPTVDIATNKLKIIVLSEVSIPNYYEITEILGDYPFIEPKKNPNEPKSIK